MSVIKVTEENFDKEVLQADEPVLVDFWAEWCGPCKMLSPIIEEVAKTATNIKVCKINVDEAPELASKYQIMSIPTLLVMKQGEIINKSVGAKDKQAILDMIS